MFLKIKNSASLGCVMFTRPARVSRGQNLWPILRLICICYRPVRWSAGACPRARSSVVQLRALSQALKPFSCEMKRKPAASNTRSASSVEITRPESRTGRRGHDVGGFCTSAEIDWMRVRTMPPTGAAGRRRDSTSVSKSDAFAPPRLSTNVRQNCD